MKLDASDETPEEVLLVLSEYGWDGVAKGNQRTEEVKGEKGEAANLKRPTASLGQPICTVGGKPTR